MDFAFRGKTALVTGSSSGIGTGIAAMLAREGAAVVVHGRDAARSREVATRITAAGGTASWITGDLDSSAGAADVAHQALAAFGAVDILVNNAGGRLAAGAPVDWFSIPPDDWTLTYNRNVTSAVRLIHQLVGGMKERGWGRIINIASCVANTPSGSVADYAAAKNGLANLTVGLSKALAGTGVTINTVSPGVIHTAAADEWLATVARTQGFGEDIGRALEWVFANSLRQTVHRFGEIEDVAYAVCCLASPMANFIAGANFRVDGGASPAVN